MSGREGELAQIRRAVRTQGSGVLLTGPIGIGLTTILTEAAEDARSRGSIVAEISGKPRTAHVELAAFAHLAPVEEYSAAPLAGQMSAVFAALRRAADGRHLVLFADDAQWLDGASLAIARQLLESGAGTLIAALRTPEPGATDLERLWQAGRLTLIEPHPLDVDELAELVTGALGGTLAEPLVNYLHTVTLGRPGLVRPVVLDALDARAIRNRSGMWVGERTDFPLPRTARAARLALSDEPNEVGRVVRYVALAHNVPMAALDLLVNRESIAAAEDRGWIEINPHGRVRIVVSALGEGAVRSLGVAAASAMRGDLVQAWSGLENLSEADQLRLVVLARDTAEPPSAAELSRAARLAAARLQPDLAADLARGARADDRPEFSDLLVAANAQTLRSASSSPAITELTERATSDTKKARAAYEQGTALMWNAGDPASAGAYLNGVLTGITDPTARGELHGLLALASALEWRFDEARAQIAEALKAPRTDATCLAVGQAALSVRIATAQEVPGAPSVRQVEAALDRHPTRMTSVAGWFGQLGMCCFLLGENRELATVIERWRARGLQEVLPFGAALSATLQGEYCMVRGQVRTAYHHFVQARAVLQGGGATVWRSRDASRTALACAMLGKFDEARAMIETSQEQSGDPGRISMQLNRVATYWLTAGEGDPGRAVQLALDDADKWRDQGATAAELIALHQAVRFGDSSRAARLVDLAARFPVARAQVAASAARALRDQDPTALAAAAQQAQHEEMGLAALDIQVQAAGLARKRGNRAGYLAGLGQANRIREAGGNDTPSWWRLHRDLPLTAREAEVARLVASGLTNAEVAERLVISPRTAEGHLQRVFDKLGLHDRSELTAVLGLVDDGLPAT